MNRNTKRARRTAGPALAAVLLTSYIAAAADGADDGPVVHAGADGFALESADGSYKLRIRGLLQVDARAFIDDAVEGNDELLIRRARIELTGTLAKHFDFRIMPDFAGSTATLLDLWVMWRARPELGLQIGKVKSPVGLEREQSREHNLFVEFGYPTALVPNRDIHVGARGAVAGNRLGYYLGISNGTADGASVVDDVDDSKSMTWRLFATPFKKPKHARSLGFGVAGTLGDTTNGHPSDYRTVGQQTFFSWRKAGGGSSGAFVQGAVRRVVPQAYWYVGPFGLMAEHATSSQELVIDGTHATLESAAWQVSASWVLTGEAATFRGIQPARAVGAECGGAGAWQLVARYTELDVDDAAFPAFADPATSADTAKTTTIGVNWYGTKQVEFLLDYSRTRLESAPGGGSFDDEHAVVARVQFRY